MLGHEATREQSASIFRVAMNASVRFIVNSFGVDDSPLIDSIEQVVNLPDNINAGSPSHQSTSSGLVKLASATERYRTKSTQLTNSVPDTFSAPLRLNATGQSLPN
jgi:hypothetical protein